MMRPNLNTYFIQWKQSLEKKPVSLIVWLTNGFAPGSRLKVTASQDRFDDLLNGKNEESKSRQFNGHSLVDERLTKENASLLWSQTGLLERAFGIDKSNSIAMILTYTAFYADYYLANASPNAVPSVLHPYKANRDIQVSGKNYRRSKTGHYGVFILSDVMDLWARACNVFLELDLVTEQKTTGLYPCYFAVPAIKIEKDKLESLGVNTAGITLPIHIPLSEYAEATGEKYIFCRNEAMWTLAFDGKKIIAPDSVGLRHLHRLLKTPNVPVPAIDLYHDSTGGRPEEVDLSSSEHESPVIDSQTIKTIKAHLSELKTQQQEPFLSSEAHRTLSDEISALEKYLNSSTGLQGRPRTFKGANEKARQVVTKNIKNTFNALEEKLPKLANHLKATIKTGGDCLYLPGDTNISWVL